MNGTNLNKKQATLMAIKAGLGIVFLVLGSIPDFINGINRGGIIYAIIELIAAPLCIYAVATVLILIWTKLVTLKWKILGTIGLLLVFAFGDNASHILILNIIFIIVGAIAIVFDIKKLKNTDIEQ